MARPANQEKSQPSTGADAPSSMSSSRAADAAIPAASLAVSAGKRNSLGAALAGMVSRNRSAVRGHRPIRPAIPQLFRAAGMRHGSGALCPCAEIRQLTDVSKCNLQHYLSCKQPSIPHLLGSSPE